MAMAAVETDGVRVDASLELVDDVEVGEWVIVHVGFAIARVDEDIAGASLDALRQVGALGSAGSQVGGAGR